jgi:hypothetical protein
VESTLRGATREWAAGAGDIATAFGGVRKAVERAAGAGDIATAFGGVRKAVERAAGDDRSRAASIAAAFGGVRKAVERDCARTSSSPAMGSSAERATALARAPVLFTPAPPPVQPPPGVQPGTLTLESAREQQAPPLFDAQFGYRGNTAGARVVKTTRGAISRERAGAQDEGEGSVFEDWSGGHSVSSIEEGTWTESKDWAPRRAEAAAAMGKILALFDDMATSEVFAGARVEPTENGRFRALSSDGRCVRLERYYEFVQATLAAQMGDRTARLPAWADGLPVAVGLDKLEASLPGLRAACLGDCGPETEYTLATDGTVMRGSLAISATVRWPVDGSVLVEHKMKLRQ